jgi:hypothetical protein
MSAPLDITELGRILAATDPAAVLVPRRLLRRVIKRERKLVGIGLRVPHRKGYVMNRDDLARMVEMEELELERGRQLPATVILLARPDAGELAAMERGRALLGYWRLLFHGWVHLALKARIAEHRLTAAVVRERIHRIGQVEFEEIRAVLRHEKFLLPPRDDRAVYEEFVAVYLELKFFAATLLPRYFPAVGDFAGIDAILAQDVDAADLFARTRLAGAPDPVFLVDLSAETAERNDGVPDHSTPALVPSAEEYDRLIGEAAETAALGNVVGASIRRAWAALVAPRELADEARSSARADLDALVERLQSAFHTTDSEAKSWRTALLPLLDRAARRRWSVEARLLYDLQKACVTHEQAVFAPDLIGWLSSLFRRPLLRPLPHQPLVGTVKAIRRAVRRLAFTRVSEVERQVLSTLLHQAVHHAELELRQRIRPLIEQAVRQAGLQPRNLPEEVALHKITEELLDRAVGQGRFALGDVRDALSRNALKVADLAGASEFLGGDALLRANRRLGDTANGVYRYGEFYLRWLQRFSALAFGTPLGRFLTLYLFLPFGAAFVVLEGVQYLIHEVMHLTGREGVHFVNWPLIAAVGAFLGALIHIPTFRNRVVGAARALGRVLRAVVIDVPAHVLRWPPVRRVLDSQAFAWVSSYAIKPLLVALPIGLGFFVLGLGVSVAWVSGAVTFLGACLLLNSRLGRDLQEMLADWLTHGWDGLRDLTVGLIRLIQDVFKSVLEAIDRWLYRIDEWFQYRRGERRLALLVKVVLGPLWGAVAYVIRFIVLLFVEPQINPIKHFPVVTVAHKLLLPLVPTLAEVLAPALEVELALALTIATVIIGKLPGVFGFLVWELKENWRLYEANRPRLLEPAVIGHHGETMVRLLRPGFHSGTLPKLFAKLRRAERRAHRTGDWRASRKIQEALHHAEKSIRHFVERELVFLLRRTPAWHDSRLSVGAINVGSNRVRVELTCSDLASCGLQLTFEEQSGWLLAGIANRGWLPHLSACQRRTLETALSGLYKFADVHLVHEQLAARVGRDVLAYDMGEEGLTVWAGPGYTIEAVYDLQCGEVLRPRAVEGDAGELPVIQRRAILFGDAAITWDAWVDVWQRHQEGARDVPVLAGTASLLPPEAKPSVVVAGSSPDSEQRGPS